MESKYFDVKGKIKIDVDGLFESVCRLLGVEVKGFKANLVVLKDDEAFIKESRKLYTKIPNVVGYYTPQTNTIYVNAKQIDMFSLAHEVAHAVISHYFVQPVPEKIQEVCAGYVEYTLRKEMAGKEPV